METVAIRNSALVEAGRRLAEPRNAFVACASWVRKLYTLDDLCSVKGAIDFLVSRMAMLGHKGSARIEYCPTPGVGAMTLSLPTSKTLRIVFTSL